MHEVEASVATHVDFSNQKLGPTELIIIGWWLSTNGCATLESLHMSGNPITGGEMKSWPGRSCNHGDPTRIVLDIGGDNTGIKALLEAIPASKIKNLTIRNCGLGPKHITIVASSLSKAELEVVDMGGNLLSGSKRERRKNFFVQESEFPKGGELCDYGIDAEKLDSATDSVAGAEIFINNILVKRP